MEDSHKEFIAAICYKLSDQVSDMNGVGIEIGHAVEKFLNDNDGWTKRDFLKGLESGLELGNRTKEYE